MNILTNHAVNERMIRVFGGDQFRPNLHIEDMCRAYLSILEQPASTVNGQVFNIGADNLTVSAIARVVASHVDGPIDVRVEPSPDQRSYRISSGRIANAIGFRPRLSVGDAVTDLLDAFARGALPDSLRDSKYFNIRRMGEILNSTDDDGEA